MKNDPETEPLQRFVQAQASDYARALAEIKNGRKRSHWMWYIFPQLDGLGHSSTARLYAIKDIHEAKSFLAHPVLGPRLIEITEALLTLEGRTAEEIFGYPDVLKLRSCATLVCTRCRIGICIRTRAGKVLPWRTGCGDASLARRRKRMMAYTDNHLLRPFRRLLLFFGLFPCLLLCPVCLTALAQEEAKSNATATEIDKPAPKKLPIPGEILFVENRTAFLIAASEPTEGKPWVWYAPTLPAYPAAEEKWLFERFTAAGISVAGIDVGESYGSPAGRRLFTALHNEMQKRGFSAKPILLGRSRGGLMTLSWAAENPDKVSGFVGIYPVCNLASYPGLAKAAPAYEMTEDELMQQLEKHNPIDRLEPLAKARIPLFAIHGDVDKLVPLEENSGLLRDRYTSLGASMELIVPPGQGHNMWIGFFQCQELVDFVKKHAR